MATLVPQDGHAHLERLVLQPGVNSIGRREGNIHVVPDPSVSGQHCEVDVEEGSILVRDLGSTNGTRVDGQPVQEAKLIHGQRLALGDVQYALEAPEHAPAKSTGLRVNIVSAAAPVVAPAPVGRSAADVIAAINPVVYEEPSFFSQIPGSFAYPFRKSGIIMLVIGSILFLVLEFLGSFSFWISLVGTAYLFAFMQKVIAHSAQGEDEMPPWPELGDFIHDILLPVLMLAGCFVIALGPGLLLLFFSRENPAMAIAAFGALGLGALYFPMALLAVSVSDSFVALSPHIVLPGIARIFGPYIVTFIVLVVLAGIRVGGEFATAFIPEEMVPAQLAAVVVMGFVSLYILTVEMRILGLLFRSYRDKLGWLG